MPLLFHSKNEGSFIPTLVTTGWPVEWEFRLRKKPPACVSLVRKATSQHHPVVLGLSLPGERHNNLTGVDPQTPPACPMKHLPALTHITRYLGMKFWPLGSRA